MTLIVHRLGISQSERILWLCEELEIPYQMVKHVRHPVLSPPSLMNLPGNEVGKAPFVEDTETGLKMAESGAICEYIIFTYGSGRLYAKPSDPNYFAFLYWWHYSNASCQPTMVCSMFINMANVPAETPIKQFADDRLEAMLKHIDDRLAQSKWLAGAEFSAAEVMTVYALTTQRYFGPLANLGPYKNVLRWFGDCAARPAYQRAMKKGDPEMHLLLGAEPPRDYMMAYNGIESDHWKGPPERT